jgi:cyanophycinase
MVGCAQYAGAMLGFRHFVYAGLVIAATASLHAHPGHAYKYFRVGSAQDVATKTRPGFALMGGGTDLDEAFRWLCARANGGDFLVLRAAGTDAYNPYIAGLEDRMSCKLNSVATLVIPSREAAGDPFVAQTIAHAEVIFIAGGDQANYIRFWMGTPVQTEINAAIRRGAPIGGTSAGLAVMGEWAYSAEGDRPDDPNLDGKTALMDPLGPRVALVRGFLEIPILKGIITDSHFAKRDRMGRLLVFLSHIRGTEPGGNSPLGMGIDESTAMLLNTDGKAIVVGKGSVYLVEQHGQVFKMPRGQIIADGFDVLRIGPSKDFDLLEPNLLHSTATGTAYSLTVSHLDLLSSQPGDAVY